MLAGGVFLGSIVLSAWVLETMTLSDPAKVLLLGAILVGVAVLSRRYLKRQ